MQTNKTLISVLLFSMAIFIAGCAKPKLDDLIVEGEDNATTEEMEGGDSMSGVGDEGSVVGEGLDGTEVDSLLVRTVYFGFDESLVSEEAQVIIQAHAEVLVNDPEISISVAGHADERGTREYNLALGDQRGEAVSRYFQQFGIDASRISVVSYGEEQPAVMGANEEAWSLNRRVEFEY